MLILVRILAKRLAVVFMGAVALLKLHATFTMFLSMAISVLVYALPFGFWFAVGFVVLLFAHEFGHVLASRAVGVSASPPLFIPFLGAMIRLGKKPQNAKMEANIAIGGPAMGALSALLCIAFYFWTDSVLLLVLAYTACILNLFNLIPSDPLDGGKIAAAISPLLWWGGAAVIGALFFYTYNAMIFVIFIFSLRRLWGWRGAERDEAYDQLSAGQRFTVFWRYIGLVAVLGAATLYIGDLLR